MSITGICERKMNQKVVCNECGTGFGGEAQKVGRGCPVCNEGVIEFGEGHP